MNEENEKLLSTRQKMLLELFKKSRVGLGLSDVGYIYSSSYNLTNALKRLATFGFIRPTGDGRFKYITEE